RPSWGGRRFHTVQSACRGVGLHDFLTFLRSGALTVYKPRRYGHAFNQRLRPKQRYSTNFYMPVGFQSATMSPELSSVMSVFYSAFGVNGVLVRFYF
ncbi:MAG: hypothetical protein J0653_03955, partial [Deltaproteobacteria bacterium]|nr:hypothetical protein [Deltaproteobacteria bacterium]